MAVEVDIQTISAGYNISKINTNFQRIDTALQDAISRSGSAPNSMDADLDLNGNDLLNAGNIDTETLFVNGVDVVDIVGREGPPGPTGPQGSGANGNVLDVMSYGAVGDGITDDTLAIQATLAAASGSTPPRKVLIPAGNYIISSTLTIPNGVVLEGEGPSISVLIPTIINGDSCVNVAASAQFWGVHDLAIETGIDREDFLDGSIDGQNCIGLQAYQLSSNWPARYSISNLRIQGCATGLRIRTFIGNIENVHIRYCDLGFDGALLNAVRANFRLEENRKSFSITESDGLHMDNLLDEGVLAGTVASTLDSSRGVTFTSPYFEGHVTYPRTEPFLIIGGTTEVAALRITGARIVGSSGLAAGVPPIKLDRVNTAYIETSISEGSQRRTIETTSNTLNYTLAQVTASGGMIQDNGAGIGPPINYFTNPYFDVWFRGWNAVNAVRATFSQETTIRRRGPNSLRIAATAGQANNHCEIRIAGEAVTALRGKTIRLGAWIWIPDIVEYDEVARDSWPDVIISSFNGSVSVSSVTQSSRMVKGAWNYFFAPVTMQSDATRIDIALYANHDPSNATGNEYIIVDSITIVEAVTSLDYQMRGEVIDSPLITKFTTGRMVDFGTAAPTDVDQTYAVGDQVWKTNAASGASPGWICTTAGVGGTAVFTAMGNLA